MRIVTLCFCLVLFMNIYAEDTAFGNSIAELSGPIVKRLAERVAPDEKGAMGRNRRNYFHVRFQLGMHHLANYGLIKQQPRAVELFLNAAEYSFRHQEVDGSFKVVIPSELEELGVPSQADQASGVAFFLSSLGSGIHALETNKWFNESVQCDEFRDRLAVIKEKLPSTLSYIMKHCEQLKIIDRAAPNRLLFNGLALYSIGKILSNEKALEAASEFIALATSQVHEEGYFIEGGGFDSSYNGVAAALAWRLLLMGYSKAELGPICVKAINWQKGRITDEGKIRTDGNTRVNPGGDGESFLGRTKDVDVAHTIEALLLAAQYMDNAKYGNLASRVYDHYRKNQK